MNKLMIACHRFEYWTQIAAIAWLAAGLASLSSPASAQGGTTGPSETEAIENYKAAKSDGRDADAVKYLLDYMEHARGENAPMTISLMQRYGNALLEEGKYWKSAAVLKEARERAVDAFGEDGPELVEIYLDLGRAYAARSDSVLTAKRYFDAALDVLRKNDQQETVLYVKTLVAVAAGLTEAGVLEGTHSADTDGASVQDLVYNGYSSAMRRFESGYLMLEEYLEEANELARDLATEDPYLTAKIAIIQSKIKVRETLFLQAVSPIIHGSISPAAAEKRFQLEDSNLSAAADVLMQDADLNGEYLSIANAGRMEIAWLSEDKERMSDFCSGDKLNMTADFPPERLFEIADDGRVIAPAFSFRISTDIFNQTRRKIYDARFRVRTGRSAIPTVRRPEVGPYFLPVCIDGRLMAALVNAPRVEIEDLE